MQISRAAIGTKVLNKMNGREFIIAGKHEEEENSFLAVEVLPEEDSDKEPETVFITSKNAIIFRVIKDAEPGTPEGYTVENGILKKSGEQVTEQGEIRVERILYCAKGKLFLLAESEEENCSSLLEYNTVRDRFKELIDVPSGLQVVERKDGKFAAYYGYLTETVDATETEDAYEKFITGEALFFEGENVKIKRFSTVPETVGLVIGPDGPVSGRLVLWSEKAVYDGVINESDPYTQVICENGEDRRFDIKDAEVTQTSFGVLAKGKDRFEVSGYGPVKASIDDRYRFVVDVTEKANTTIYSIASEDYEVCTVTVTKTRDRGNVVEVSK